jgi:hypothetical protein
MAWRCFSRRERRFIKTTPCKAAGSGIFPLVRNRVTIRPRNSGVSAAIAAGKSSPTIETAPARRGVGISLHRHCKPTGPREARPDYRLREAIHPSPPGKMDCFVRFAPRNNGAYFFPRLRVCTRQRTIVCARPNRAFRCACHVDMNSAPDLPMPMAIARGFLLHSRQAS